MNLQKKKLVNVNAEEVVNLKAEALKNTIVDQNVVRKKIIQNAYARKTAYHSVHVVILINKKTHYVKNKKDIDTNITSITNINTPMYPRPSIHLPREVNGKCAIVPDIKLQALEMLAFLVVTTFLEGKVL